MKYINFAIPSNEATPLELTNKKITLEAALEAIILLKNDNNTLPLTNKEIDFFGNGARHTIKGGLGSGEVNELNVSSIYDAFKEIKKAYKNNKISENDINKSASNVLKSIMKSSIYKKYKNM